MAPHTTAACLYMIRTYCDESYKDKRVYVIGGYVARRKTWDVLARQWKARRLQDGISCFHAADCEGGWDEFERLSKDQRRELKTDLIAIVNQHPVSGFGSAILIEDWHKVRESHPKGPDVLGQSPYFLCLQLVLSALAERFNEENPGVRTSLVFEEQEEFSGRAKALYDDFKALNFSYASRLTTLTYASKKQFVPLEVADNVAYEVMKEMLNNRWDPGRDVRKSFRAMRPRLWHISYLNEQAMINLCDASISKEDRLRIIRENKNAPPYRRIKPIGQ
jgi:Protein of unknown function (DUF3800)